jgi:hypothetical protein
VLVWAARALSSVKRTAILSSGVSRNFVRGGGELDQQIQLRTEGRENVDLGAVVP